VSGKKHILWIEREDPGMQQAIERAQATLAYFCDELATEAQRIVPAFDAVVIKAFFPDGRDPMRGEHMWLEDVTFKSGVFHGRLANEPGLLEGFSEGDDISVAPSQVSDWVLVRNGKGEGGYTLELISHRMTHAEWSEAATLPPFIWFV
jgi:uncharacterized protein YegJ (DUF2314 family)